MERNNFHRERDCAPMHACEREKKGEEVERKNTGEEGGENERERERGEEEEREAFPPTSPHDRNSIAR